MPNTFLIGDLHFGHKNIITFKDDRGFRIRPFDSIEQHDQALIDNWNTVVGPRDKVYVLGDVTFNHKHLYKLAAMNGTKVLIKGNHDVAKASQYLQYFKDIRGSHELAKILLTHIPVHESQKQRWRANIHGHLHDSVIPDTWYFNVSCEQVNFTPIALDTILEYYENLEAAG